MSNPYHAPAADLSALRHGDASYAPSLFAIEGRIGRVRYLAYGLGAVFAAMVLWYAMAAVPIDVGPNLYMAPSVVQALFLLFAGTVLARRRLHDLGFSGWWAPIQFIPVLGIPFVLWLLAAPGVRTPNRFGPAPAANARLAIATASVAALLLATSLLQTGAFFYVRLTTQSAMERQLNLPPTPWPISWRTWPYWLPH
ncbi:DUF805 domain-containing protein [Massilia sp. CF038]|uniref:DUF805 domain-containing protein n=1 Tax=Massilia sp. CF038 TaxID=1881045 RepID=UPI0009211D0A|nr:DUF805 domain-containing protein [Massilia sp. CF038]SHH04759.1 Uncharacterized membrane protein YhaH, DUF805 family [Massilia sp. CF038]